jgi:DNA-binding FadR family transcriptional regulator
MTGDETGRKADRVARDLLASIAEGNPAPGETLPTEDELAERYAVNRSVVREAIKLLEVHRLVRPVRRRGTEVLDPFASLSPEVLAAMLRRKSGVVDIAFLESFLEIRALLDVHICGMAAERRTKADLKALETQLETMRGVAGDEQAYAGASFEFGLRLSRATHNPITVMLSHWNRAVASDLPRIFHVTRAATGPHLEGLALLIEQIRARNGDQARALVTEFHKWATPRMLAAAALENGEPLSRVKKELR